MPSNGCPAATPGQTRRDEEAAFPVRLTVPTPHPNVSTVRCFLLSFRSRKVQVATAVVVTMRPLAQAKPIISRAMAVTTTCGRLLVVKRRRYRAQWRTCPFHASSRTSLEHLFLRASSLVRMGPSGQDLL